MAAAPVREPFKPVFGPVVNNLVVPNDPKKSMVQYTDIFKRFELMYGVTEMESMDLPLGGDVALIHGMLEKERDEELRKYMRMRCEMKPETCFAETRAKYNYEEQKFQQRDQARYSSHEPDRASLARDELLDILSDARTVAPVVQTGLFHSALNLQSYFYVFTHKTHSKDYIRNKTYNGEELPYVFGVPIEGPKFAFEDVHYTEDEKRLSMTIMTYFSNFAHTGNPNVPKMQTPDSEYNLWHRFDKEWYQFEESEQHYIDLDIPVTNKQFYRKEQMDYWNDVFPNITKTIKTVKQYPLPWERYSLSYDRSDKFDGSTTPSPIGIIRMFGTRYRPNVFKEYGELVTARPEEAKESNKEVSTPTLSVLVTFGTLFLFANIFIFGFLYYKCIRKKKNARATSQDDFFLLSSCNVVKLLSSSPKGEDTYDAVNPEPNLVPKGKLTRALSNSTIDAHAKVRDWITNEIVLKYSPKDDRKKKTGNKKEKKKDKKSPTEQMFDVAVKPMLIKTASIDRSHHRKRANKVSVAIDATPSGRGASVLAQQPIELTKSLDCAPLRTTPLPLRRSLTMEDFSPRKLDSISQELRKSITSIDLKCTEPTIIKIGHYHSHSKSDPVENLDYSAMKRLKTFDPNSDVNVTSRDESDAAPQPLTPEESLLTIKRRNFPKVLPDHPGRQAFLSKRRSMPVHNLYIPPNELYQYSNSEPYSPTGRNFMKFPPVPPPRTTTLGRQGSNPQPVCLSEPMLVEEQPSSPEPEVACNNLYVGPLIPKGHVESRAVPKAIVTTDSQNPIKRAVPRSVVKAPSNRSKYYEVPNRKNIPRVVVPDNRPDQPTISESVEESGEAQKKMQILTVKSTRQNLQEETSKSESTSPSSEESSDADTVVKNI